MKNIIVTGATSMLGISLIEEALKAGEIQRIYAVIRPDTERTDRLPQDARIVRVPCRAEEYSELPALIPEKCQVFYHMAWAVTGAKRNEDYLAQVRNIEYTLNALDAACGLGCGKFIGCGSQAEYGRTAASKMGPDLPVWPVQTYGIAKYAAGRMVLQKVKKLGITGIWVRVFSVFGKYDKESTMVMTSIAKMQKGIHCAYTKGEQLWDYLYCKDAGRAFFLLGEKGEQSKVYCLGSGNALPLYQYIKTIQKVTESSSPLAFGAVPYPPEGPLSICADISELCRDTGWKPEWSFEEGIRDMLKPES